MQPLAIVEQVDGGTIIRLNRAEKRNAVNDALAAAVIAALDAAEADPDVRVIVITGTGSSFSAGQDMAEATGRVERPQPGTVIGSAGMSTRIGGVEKPVIAAINGFCMGGGTATALQCDVRICSEDATFRFPGTSYGLVVAASLLPAVVGQSRAKDLIFSGRTIDAHEAYRIGLVDHLVPASELEDAMLAYMRSVAANSPDAIRMAKRIINLGSLHDAAVELEAGANRTLRRGDDHAERFGRAADRIVGSRGS
jgi:enoyl-CoA hydratase/carnithine racemase